MDSVDITAGIKEHYAWVVKDYINVFTVHLENAQTLERGINCKKLLLSTTGTLSMPFDDTLHGPLL